MNKSIATYIQVSEQELKDKTGVYLDPVLRRFWTLEVEDGKLAVSAINGMRFRIAPVSQTEFREFEAPVRIDVRFQNRGEGEPPLMHLSIGRQKSYALMIRACQRHRRSIDAFFAANAKC